MEESYNDLYNAPKRPPDNKPPRHPGGAPPKYKTPEEMQGLVDKYFRDTVHPVITKEGIQYLDGPYTMTGLAIALGFTSRQALWNYEQKEEFVDVIARARARVIEYAEGRLYDKDGARGAQFALENFNDDWSSVKKLDVTGTVTHELAPADWQEMERRVVEARQKRLAATVEGSATVVNSEQISP